MTKPAARIIYVALWGVLIALYLVAPLRHLDAYAWDYDEGPYLQAAALAARGHPLYADVVLNKLPYLTWLLQAGFATGGLTLITARATILLTTLLGFVSLGLLSELWWGKGAGPATLLVFLTLSETTVRAAVVMNDLPAMSLVLATLVAATRYRQRAQRRWLFVSALAFALAVGTHPLLLFTAVPILWICIASEQKAPPDLRRIVRVLVVFGIVGAIVLGMTLLVIDLPGFVRWVVDYNTTAAQNAAAIFGWVSIAEYLTEHWPLLGLTACALVLLAQSRRRLGISASIVWAFMTLSALALYRPLWQHYLIFLLYPLVIVAGGGVVESFKLWGKSSRKTTPHRIVGLASLCLLALMGYQRLRIPLDWSETPAGHDETAAYLTQHIEPEDFIVTDNQFFAFAQGYPVPPALTDTSFKRIRHGYLQIGEVVSAIHAHDVHFVVLDNDAGRFHHFPEMMGGIEAITDDPTCFDALCIYPVRRYHTTASTLGAAVRLAGYTTVEEGNTQTITFYWESLQPLDEDLTVFVHLLDENGNLVAQHDGPPLFGDAPTSNWETGMLIPDPHPLALSNIAPGTYTVTVGMYRRPSLERLPAFDVKGRRWQHDAIVLTTINVDAP